MNLRRRRPESRTDPFDQYAADLGVDTVLASEVGQFHTFAIPRISALLRRTGEYHNDGVRRLDDTKALMAAPLTRGPDSAEGREAIAQINRIHAQYAIRNDDYLYVLSTFGFGSERWNERYGWRPITDSEKRMLYERIRCTGVAMGIDGVPADGEELRRWVDNYLDENRRSHPDNHALAEAMMRAVEAMVPRIVRPLVSPVTRVWMGDPELLAALGYSLPPRPMVWAVNGAMALRKWFLARFTAMRGRDFFDLFLANHLSSRPDGFTSYRELGPMALLEKFGRREDPGAVGAEDQRTRPSVDPPSEGPLTTADQSGNAATVATVE